MLLLGRSLEGVIEHVADHLLERGIGNDGQILANTVVVAQLVVRPSGAPIMHRIIQKTAERGGHRRFAPGLARRQQDAADDGLATRHLCFHLRDFGSQFRLCLDLGQTPPVTQDNGQGRQWRTQLVRCPRGQQPHAYDMFLFDHALTHGGQAGVALTQRGCDTGDEDHQQAGVEGKTHQQSQHIETEQPIMPMFGQHQWMREHRQANEAERGQHHHGPGQRGGQQHRTQNHLQQIEEHERVGCAAAIVELSAERHHIHEQSKEHLDVTDRPARTAAQQAQYVEEYQRRQHSQHLRQWKGYAQAVDYGDGGDLTDHRDPAELNQMV